MKCLFTACKSLDIKHCRLKVYKIILLKQLKSNSTKYKIYFVKLLNKFNHNGRNTLIEGARFRFPFAGFSLI